MIPVVYRGDSDEYFSLLLALRRVPTTTHRIPEEDQLTTVLAWLCALSPTAADALARLLLAGDLKALDAVGSEPLRARTQVRLPRLSGSGELIADFSLEAPHQALQLLVEIKLDADLAVYPVDGVDTDQPNAYIAAWRQCDKDREARVRRVGTITLGGLNQPRIKWRAGDITWKEVFELLTELRQRQQLEPTAEAVANELIYYLGERVLAPETPDGELERAVNVIHDIAVAIAAALPSARARGSARTWNKTGYVSENIDVDIGDGEQLTLWVAFTPKRTTYNVVGWPNVLQLAVMEEGLSESMKRTLRVANFEPLRDRAKSWKPYRIWRNWDELMLEPDPVTDAVDWAIPRFREAGLMDSCAVRGALSPSATDATTPSDLPAF